MTTTAKIIADSISEAGIRITTLELEYPRFIHSQFMTHRMFSRNAQSSRAIPTAKQIELISDLHKPNFEKNQAGMQAGEILSDVDMVLACQNWDKAKNQAIEAAKELIESNVHKQWANRLLEPFATIKVVVTATEWDNFFALRLHHDAQPEIQELAQAMKKAMDESEPKLLENCEFHLPYISYIELSFSFEKVRYEQLPLISAARCARVSYLNHDNSNPDIEKDLELARHLLKSGHLSPFEHQAKPMKESEFFDYEEINYKGFECGVTHITPSFELWSNNFRGWIMHRAIV